MHANEIVLLAYYIASVNIEHVYPDLVKSGAPGGRALPSVGADVLGGPQGYTPFEGICLTDTFELYEKDDFFETKDFQQNSARVQRQRKSPIRIVIGNPPYSIGQKSANDNAQNQSYPKLEAKIADTYAKRTQSTNKNALYDSYIKAFRWATDRLEGGKGIVAFISNAGWLDASAMDGFRATLQEEFDSIYVFNLRGNQRTSGELSRKEGGKIFGSGSRTPIAITLLVRNGKSQTGFTELTGLKTVAENPVNPVNPVKNTARIYYRDIGDYLSREKKLEIIRDMRSMLDPKMSFVEITPNEKNDWINQRDGLFDSLIPIEPEKKYEASAQSAFILNTRGLETSRDHIVYNFSRKDLEENVRYMFDVYNSARKSRGATDDSDSARVVWTRKTRNNLAKDIPYAFESECCKWGLYRAFSRQHVYESGEANEYVNHWPRLFPASSSKNRVICISGVGGTRSHSCLMTDIIPDLNVLDAGTQCFPLYVYAKEETDQLNLFDKGDGGYRRESGITDFMLERCRKEFGEKVTKEDIFYYIYAVLHSPDYRKRFEADLKKSLARIPLCKTGAEFAAFVKAGKKLGDLHCGYEKQEPWKECVVDVKPAQGKLEGHDGEGAVATYAMTKMRFAEKEHPVDENKNGKLDRRELEDRSRIIYNDRITIRGIPLAAYDYVVNGKSAIEWVMERYQVTTNKDSGIVNDPNKWLEESNDERYIVDLILKVVTVSMETQKIVAKLPRLEF